MAKYFQTKPGFGFAYALEDCEDYLIIDALYGMLRYFPHDERLRATEENLMRRGLALGESNLVYLNSLRRTKNLSPFVFRKGHSSPHSIMRGGDKVERRRAMKEHLDALSAEDRKVFLVQKLSEAQAIEERPDLPIYQLAPSMAPQPAPRAPVELPAPRVLHPVSVTPPEPEPADGKLSWRQMSDDQQAAVLEFIASNPNATYRQASLALPIAHTSWNNILKTLRSGKRAKLRSGMVNLDEWRAKHHPQAMPSAVPVAPLPVAVPVAAPVAAPLPAASREVSALWSEIERLTREVAALRDLVARPVTITFGQEAA